MKCTEKEQETCNVEKNAVVKVAIIIQSKRMRCLKKK